MKIAWKHGDRSVEFERKPMPEGRFRALCKLAGGAIGGTVLLLLVHMLGVWALGALALAGLYSLIRDGFMY